MNDNIKNKNKKNEQYVERERERVISRCNSCWTLIHEGELAYIFDKGKKIEKPRWVKCEECYNQLQTKVEEYYASVSKWWKGGWIFNAVVSIIAFIAAFIISEDFGVGLFFLVIAFIAVCLLTWITRLIWRPYHSTIEKLVYSVREEEKEEAKEENPKV